jgi:signal transduction histidine kinase
MKVRRRLFWGGLAAMIVVVLVAGYAIVRSVERELSVARLQGDFVSAVSHEFRTPLASLCHLSELLVEGRVPNDQRRQEYYQALRRESERLHRLVEGLLDFRRMEEDAGEYQREWLDTTTLIREVAEEFAQEVKDRGYTVDIEVEKSLPRLRADREALSRVLWNLLDNAVKYSPDCRTVWIQASRASDQVAIRVRDEGVGIAQSEQEQIFDKFFRASSAKAAGVRGTGLGLAMVQHIVTDHGGQLLVESQPGAGSTFTLNLPFEKSSE